MDWLGQYVLSVSAAALICGIVTGLTETTPAKGIIRLMCGLALAIQILSPLGDLDIQALEEFALSYEADGFEAAAMGENMARASAEDIIKAKTEAYILDKAAAVNATITADVTLCQDGLPVPVSVSLRGSVPPYARKALEDYIQKELGIPKENQLWTG